MMYIFHSKQKNKHINSFLFYSYFTSSFSSTVKSKSCLSDLQTASANAPFDGTSAPNSSPVNPKFPSTPSPTTSILGSPPLSPNESTHSLPCLPTGENYSSSKPNLNASRPSLDGYATITSSNAIDRQQLCLSPSMKYLDKNDAMEIQSNTSDDDIERFSESNTIIMII